jgi:hypothetical protein
MTFERLEVEGWPRTAVSRLDAKLAIFSGGAQIWQLAGHPRSAAVGVMLPERPDDAHRCREIVEDWKREQPLVWPR